MYIPTDDGYWVNEQYERLAEVVQDYDPQFALYWVPPNKRQIPEDSSKCYAIVDVVGDYVVFYAGDLDTPETILENLFNADNKNGNVLDRLEARNNAIQIMQMKEKLDLAEEKQDKVSWLMKTKQNFINMGNGRVVDDQLRTVRYGKR